MKKWDYELMVRWLTNYKQINHLTQLELSKRIGCSREKVNGFLHGRTQSAEVVTWICATVHEDAITGFIIMEGE